MRGQGSALGGGSHPDQEADGRSAAESEEVSARLRPLFADTVDPWLWDQVFGTPRPRLRSNRPGRAGCWANS